MVVEDKKKQNRSKFNTQKDLTLLSKFAQYSNFIENNYLPALSDNETSQDQSSISSKMPEISHPNKIGPMTQKNKMFTEKVLSRVYNKDLQ